MDPYWLFGLIFIALIVLMALACYKDGYESGFEAGRRDGFREARHLPIGVIEEVSLGPDGFIARAKLDDDVTTR